MDINKLVAAYVKARDKKAELKKAYDEKVASLDEWMTKAEQHMLAYLQSQNAESIRTESGTVFIAEKTSATIADRDAFLQYLLDNDAMYMLDVKANKTAVKEFINLHNDLPPGVNWRVVREPQIRRS